MSGRICYKDVHQYKYQLLETYQVEIDNRPPANINTTFIKLTTEGLLTISEGYSWDGPSGPTIDTNSFMRAHLFTIASIS